MPLEEQTPPTAMTQAPTPAPQRKIEYVFPPNGVPNVYANNIAMGTTKFDVRMIFGEVRDISEAHIAIEQRVQVTMSWHEAKILADFLWANIKAYEELNGPLKLPQIPPKVITPDTYPTS